MTTSFMAVALAIVALAGCAGSPTEATSDPGSGRIFYTEIDGAGTRYVSSMAADGSDNRQLVRDAELVDAPADGKMIIAFRSLLCVLYHLSRTDGMGLHGVPVYSSPATVRLSPDGREIAILAISTLSMTSTDSTRIRFTQLTFWGGDVGPRFSPDGHYIFSPCRDPDFTSASPRDRIQIVTADAGAVRTILLDSTIHVSPNASDAAWSPDGSTIVFTGRQDTAGGSTTLYAIEPDGGNPTARVVVGNELDGPLGSPAWRPDGGEIAFSTTGGIWSVRPDGSGLRQLLRTDGIEWPTNLQWSADGRKILFGVVTSSTRGIRVLDVASGSVIRLSDHGTGAYWER